MNKTIIALVAATLIMSISLIIMIYAFQVNDKPSHKIQVVTTLFPVYDMARNIGGQEAEVSLLLPPGTEAHSFEPKPSDIVKINEADIFIYTGKFMEPWALDILKSVNNKKLVVVDASQDVQLMEAIFHDDDEPVGSMDPHIWLDFDNIKVMSQNIQKAFEKVDEPKKDNYKKNLEDYNKTFAGIDQKYKETLSTCASKEIIYAGHYAFGYLARRYDLKYLAAVGISPNAEPTANDLANLIDQINKDKIQYIFYEELNSPKIAQTISKETGAKLLSLNAGHNLSKKQFEDGISLAHIFEDDLNNLKIGLHCQ